MSTLTPFIKEIDNLLSHCDKIISQYKTSLENLYNLLKLIEKVNLMIRTNEIDQRTYEELIKDYKTELRKETLRIAHLRELLKGAKAKLKAQLMKLKLKIETEGSISSLHVYSSSSTSIEENFIKELNHKIGEIDNLLNNLKIDEEITALVYCLNQGIKDLNNEQIIELRSYLEDISNKWSTMRSELYEEINTLEEKINELELELKENDVRFILGEYDKITYEEKRIKIERDLEKIRLQMDSIRERIDRIDSQIMKCFEVLGETS